MSEIKQDTLDLAKTLKGAITIGENGVATIKEGTYVENLPEGLTEDHVKQLQGYHSALGAAGTLALGELGVPYLKKHKEVDRIELTVPAVGKDTLDFTFDRQKVVTVPKKDGPNEEKTVYGASTFRHSEYSTRPRGELSKVKDHLYELAAKQLG